MLPSTTITIDGQVYQAETLREALNYGHESLLFSKIATELEKESDESKRVLEQVFCNVFLVDKSLLDDLLRAFQWEWSSATLSESQNSEIENKFKDRLERQDNRLAKFVVDKMLSSWITAKFWSPLSFQVKHITLFLKFWKEGISKGDHSFLDIAELLAKFETEHSESWTKTFGTLMELPILEDSNVVVDDLNIPVLVHALMAGYFPALEGVLYALHGFTSAHPNSIREAISAHERHRAKTFTIGKNSTIPDSVLSALAWHEQRTKVSNRATLLSTLKMANYSDSLAQLYIETALGITKGETQKAPLGDLYAPLGDLKASVINHGPFKVDLTFNPSEHLTFARVRNKLTMRILDLGIIFRLYMLQVSGIAR